MPIKTHLNNLYTPNKTKNPKIHNGNHNGKKILNGDVKNLGISLTFTEGLFSNSPLQSKKINSKNR